MCIYIYIPVVEPRLHPCSSCLFSTHGLAALALAGCAYARIKIRFEKLLEYREERRTNGLDLVFSSVEPLPRPPCLNIHFHFLPLVEKISGEPRKSCKSGGGGGSGGRCRSGRQGLKLVKTTVDRQFREVLEPSPPPLLRPTGLMTCMAYTGALVIGY